MIYHNPDEKPHQLSELDPEQLQIQMLFAIHGLLHAVDKAGRASRQLMQACTILGIACVAVTAMVLFSAKSGH